MNGLYILDDKTVVSSTSVASRKIEDYTILWHRRLGHVSEWGMQELTKQGLLDKSKMDKLEFCEHCMLGKSTGVNFGKGERRTKGTLNYVHLELWEPIRVETLGGARYFISIIDEYSRKIR